MVAVSAPNPPTTTTAGKGPVPLGSSTRAEKVELLPLCATLTVTVLLDTVPVTVAGLAGFSPKTNFSASSLISARRQRQSDLAVMVVPFSFLKGSGSLALVGSEPRSGRPDTGQSTPSSSTAAASVPTAA